MTQSTGSISRDEVLMGRDKAYPLTQDLEENLDTLLRALNKFRALYGKPMVVSSGYRPGPFNAAAHGAAHSNHMVCMACDFHDSDGSFAAWCLRNLNLLEEAGVWLEDPRYTHGWVHLQAVPPRSGNRVFIP